MNAREIKIYMKNLLELKVGNKRERVKAILKRTSGQKRIMSGPYLSASYWIDPKLNSTQAVRQQMVSSVLGMFIWRDTQVHQQVEVTYVRKRR